jgi:hypothetical protein
MFDLFYSSNVVGPVVSCGFELTVLFMNHRYLIVICLLILFLGACAKQSLPVTNILMSVRMKELG